MTAQWWWRAAGLAFSLAFCALPGCRQSPASIDAAPKSKPVSTIANRTTEPPNHRTTEKDGMVLLPAGTFTMGDNNGMAFEAPAHKVTLDSFWIDKYEVTVAQFEKFVKATNYKTTAEKLKWSGVCDVNWKTAGTRKGWTPMPGSGGWFKSDGADWRHPEGPDTKAKPNEPVCHVSYDDAVAYAKWAQKRLPTEAEFEYAMRGGHEGQKYPWGDELTPEGKYMSNWWQGIFPEHDEGKDGIVGRAPVGSYPPNGYGLHDVAGNVWEWCADWMADDYYQHSPRKNPKGPAKGKERVLRGGSWLCSENYCTGYRSAARSRTEPDSGLNNLGFRCARDAQTK